MVIEAGISSHSVMSLHANRPSEPFQIKTNHASFGRMLMTKGAAADLYGQSNRRPIAISFQGGGRCFLTDGAKREQRSKSTLYLRAEMFSFQRGHMG
jgi:hypothetical protein